MLSLVHLGDGCFESMIKKAAHGFFTGFFVVIIVDGTDVVVSHSLYGCGLDGSQLGYIRGILIGLEAVSSKVNVGKFEIILVRDADDLGLRG